MGKPMTVDLQDRVVIITGAGGAIGHAMALDFARNGAKVVAAGRTMETLEKTASEITAAGGEAAVIQADVGSKASAAALIEQTVEKYGRLDILVNNAGINGGPEYRKKIYEYSDELWERIINTDLNGVYYCSKPAASYMVEHGGGSIINISSIVGVIPLRLQCAFTAAKAGVINLSKAMAIELAEYKIRVNVICPGSVMNEGVKELFYNDKERTERILSHIPMYRPGAPEEISSLTCFLASDDASYITGSVNIADGGWTCGYARDF
jgi:NAD(P)-dependent dehydrogenase (short-subunit alcohol dehydrogenase family)